MGLKLSAGMSVFLDTAPLIYFFEENERYIKRLSGLFETITEMEIQAVTSLITYIEILTLPEKHGATRLAAKYRDFLTNSEQISIYPLTLPVADEAVRLRAAHGLRTPDAIQLAVARLCGADRVITNDRSWRGVPGVDVVLVEEL